MFKLINLIYSLHWHLSKEYELPGLHKEFKGLKKERILSTNEWKELRNQRLRQLLIHVKNYIPYYKKIFKEINFDPETVKLPDSLGRIPILTKEIIRNNLSQLIDPNVNRSLIYENATGGSTGVPLKFYQDYKYQTIATAIDTYVKEWWGIKPYDRIASIWGADREFNDINLKEKFYQWRFRYKSINAFRMNDENMLKFFNILKRWKPPYLTGYSSALEALAILAQKYNIENLKFKAIRSSAEVLWPHQRKIIEETFNSPVYNFYGSRETNNLAAECSEAKRLHLISTWRYIEITDEKGNPLPDGKVGYIVVTDLSNYAMPFIRYRNEDMGSIDEELCPCGRPSPVLKDLLGRSSDLIRTPKGEIIHGEFFTHLFYGSNGIKRFQIHQKALDHVIIRYEQTGELTKDYMNKIVDKIQDRMGEGVKVDVEVWDEIPIPPSGKYRFTISEIKFDL